MNYPIKPVAEFESLVDWCVSLIQDKGAPGFVVGISGTDSILAFLVCAEAFRRVGRPERVIGVHFGFVFRETDYAAGALDRILGLNPSYRLVPRVVIPWLKSVASSATIYADETGVQLDDHARWAKLFSISLEGISKTEMMAGTGNYWVVGTRNATEEALGTYSNLSSAASVQPIINVWKSDVLKICRELGVPEAVISQSRQVDCDCGRFDLAAGHIEEVDLLLQKRRGITRDPHALSRLNADTIGRLEDFIDEQIRASEFKRLIPWRPGSSHSPSPKASPLSEIIDVDIAASAATSDLSLTDLLKVDMTFKRLRQSVMALGHAFSSWRFASMRVGGESLLQKYGFTRLDRDTDQIDGCVGGEDLFGPGYVLQRDGWYLELRRAYVLVSWMHRGEQVSLVIRNNSHYFGRDRLPSPALVAIGSFSPEQLQALTPLDFETRFASLEDIFKLIVFTSTSGSEPALPGHLIDCLLEQVELLKRMEIEFDTWIGGDGRSHLLASLRKLVEQGRPLPFLGLVDVGVPQWCPRDVITVEMSNLEEQLKLLLNKRDRGADRLALLSGFDGDHP